MIVNIQNPHLPKRKPALFTAVADQLMATSSCGPIAAVIAASKNKCQEVQ
jgi:hypothetical protein